MPTYSFGEESPLKFQISDRLADRYNEAVEEFFKAQTRFNQKFGRRWDERKDPIDVRWTKKQRQAWNDFAKVFKLVVEETGPYHANDIMDDFLVKNTVSVLSVDDNPWGRIITLAATGAALYVLLRGL